MKLWGGRFADGPSEVFERFSGSLHFDRRLIDADIRGSIAFAGRWRASASSLNPSGPRWSQAFETLRQQARSAHFYDGATDEDVHTLVIRKLKDRVGALADKIHTGRSRNEQVSLDLRLWLREEIDRASILLLALLEALLECARRNPEAVVPGYTHLRRAQAVLWPHYLLSYFEMFARDWSASSKPALA